MVDLDIVHLLGDTSPIYYESVIQHDIQWDDIIENFEISSKKGCPPYTNRYEGDIAWVDRYSFWKHSSNDIPIINDISQQLQDHFTNYKITTESFLSFCSLGQSIGKHFDSFNAIYLQLLGSTKWTFYNDDRNTFTLTRGDMLYVPENVPHHIDVISPRYSVSFALESK